MKAKNVKEANKEKTYKFEALINVRAFISL